MTIDEIILLRAEIEALRAEVERLKGENANLKTVMVAAAEEIHQHWDAHCDAEGYGPANLMRRLEEGIPSQYGYTAGAFAELRQRADTAEARLERAMAALEAAGSALAGGHMYEGSCPDEASGPATRDDRCAACRAMTDIAAFLGDGK